MIRAAPLLLAALALGACGTSRLAERREEMAIAAWWIEDVSHGRTREAGELDLVDRGDRLAALARWAAGRPGGWPRPLAARRARWPQVAAQLAAAGLRPGPDGALLPAPGSAEAADLAAAENRDRVMLEGAVLGLLAADAADAAGYRAAAAEARREHGER